MNTFAIIILFAFVLEFFLELTGSILNLKALRLEIPPALQGIYKPEDYLKSQEYIRVSTRFGQNASRRTSEKLLSIRPKRVDTRIYS